ncbi:MAG TPA: D-alanine--D-alanine ligase [Bacillota bacterium]
MKIGITYDLREEYLAQGFTAEATAEFDLVETVEAIETALRSFNHSTERIGNVKSLVAKLAAGARWDLVFNIAEGLYGYGREAQIPAVLDAYRIPYTFSDPLVLALTLHKGMTKRVVRDLGISTPEFCLVENETQIETVALPWPVFAKPVAEGTSKGIAATSKIDNRQALRQVCLNLLRTFEQPVLIEGYLPGREFTVGITGTGSEATVLGVMEVRLADKAETGIYSYYNKQNYQERVEYALVSGAMAEVCSEVALKVWRGLGCRDAGRVDLKLDAAGVPNFIEVNPLAGLNPQHSDLPILARLAGIEYRKLIAMIFEAALQRVTT